VNEKSGERGLLVFFQLPLKTLAPAIEKQLSVDEVFHLFSMFGIVLRQQPLSLFPTISILS